MKRLWIYACALLMLSQAKAQNNIEQTLQTIEANNKALQANAQLVKAQKLETRTDNNLPDPTVSYAHLWGADDKSQTIGELVVTQSFDFPTLYVERNKVNKIKSAAYDNEYQALRQTILLQAKELCMDIIMLRQEQQILQERLRNANELASLYQQRLQAGDANILETNKINLELLNVKTEATLNNTALRNKLEELTALNGNVPINFTAQSYPATEFPLDFEQLKAEVMQSDPTLQQFTNQGNALRRQVSVDRQGWIPKLEVGYRRNTETGAPFNGIVVGGSLPLFQNRNKVKIAKAQLLNNDFSKENASQQLESSLLRNYREAESLYTSMKAYQTTFQAQQDLSLLKQALTGGQISMIEYFVEVSVIYQSKLNYLQLESQYQKVMAQLYKSRL